VHGVVKREDTMGRILRRGIEATAEDELMLLAAEKILEDRPELREQLEKAVDRIMDECGDVRDEEEGESCLAEEMPRTKRDFRKKIKRRM